MTPSAADSSPPQTLLVAARFCGPPQSGNGGWVAGSLAQALHGPEDGQPTGLAATVRLRRPPPLERPLTIRRGDGQAALLDGDVLVADAVDAPRLSPPTPSGPVGHAEAVRAAAAYPGPHGHPFPTCFSCGTQRDPADALCLRTGLVDADTGRHATAWTPRQVSVPVVWAALDCPGAWAAGVGERPMVLGTMTAQVDELPEAGQPHVVMSWCTGQEGRKVFTGCALYDAAGSLLAQSSATWIQVDPASVRPI